MHLTKFDPEEANGAAAGAAAETSASNPALVEPNALPDLIATCIHCTDGPKKFH